MAHRGDATKVVHLDKRTVIPGLNNSNLHLIRGGLNYNLERRRDGVPLLTDGLRMLRDQARRTPTGQWVRVVGGWSEFQFAERRLPTLDELNQAAPDTPVFFTCMIEPCSIGPRYAQRDTLPSSQKNIRPTRRATSFGTSTVLASPASSTPVEGCKNYPDDSRVIEQLHKSGELAVRIAYNPFKQKPKAELDDFTRWTGRVKPGQGNDYYRHNGAGDMSVFSAADFEDFLEPHRINGAGTEACSHSAGAESLAVPSSRQLMTRPLAARSTFMRK